jgi:hypothetical protein
MGAIAGGSRATGDLANLSMKSPPTNLLQSMQPIGNILGGVGGTLAGIGALSRNPGGTYAWSPPYPGRRWLSPIFVSGLSRRSSSKRYFIVTLC